MPTKQFRSWIRWIAPWAVAGILGACSNSDKGTEPGDTTAPAVVTNLQAGQATTSSLTLSWSAPGDDGGSGTATQYDVRYATTTITAENFSGATTVSGEPAPAGAGGTQTMTISGLAADTPYFFALRTADEASNWSAPSNVATGRTLPATAGDTTPPASIQTLTTSSATDTSVVISWTAPGDDGSEGTASAYDLRYSSAVITAANFEAASPVSAEPVPAAPGTSQQMTLTGLTPDTPYFFAIKSADEVPNWSELSNVAQARTTGGADVTAPAEVTDLGVGATSPNSITLTWTATGDDGTFGTASAYDLRYAATLITESSFDLATPVTGEPTPGSSGAGQTMTIPGLTPGTPYYFALRVADEVPNWSPISNVAASSTAPPPDVTPPAAIADLRAEALDAGRIQVEWTAPGDDGAIGQATAYDLRYSSSEITEATWAAALPVANPPAPAAAGTPQSMVVLGLVADTDYYFAIRTRDEVPNLSALSNAAQAHTPADLEPPPALMAPDFPDTVCIDSADPYAQAAMEVARAQLAGITVYTSMAATFFTPLMQAEWVRNGPCWEYSYQPFGCDWLYRACPDGLGYEFTMIWDGPCGGQTYDSWIAYRCRVNFLTRQGTFFAYERNTTEIRAAWTWTWAADGNSGAYTFYQGDPEATSPTGELTWMRSGDQLVYDLTFYVPQEAKFESHFVKTPCSGWVKTYQWTSATESWWLENQIEWAAGGGGAWDQYDESGTLQEHHSW